MKRSKMRKREEGCEDGMVRRTRSRKRRMWKKRWMNTRNERMNRRNSRGTDGVIGGRGG